MKLNKYQKEVLHLLIDIFEENGDDTKMDVLHSSKLNRAYQTFKNACKIKYVRPPKQKVRRAFSDTCDPVSRNPVTGVWERI